MEDLLKILIGMLFIGLAVIPIAITITIFQYANSIGKKK